ncbi:outer membrane beta-barrel family protein [Hymenobacter ruricola]|uniref:TonB-dependent receptor n=1 Tax=Hymenobacter ruricola TaxID=2791023 RepID=A0ABS0I316_9BACT|nr:outer membrane beta-barrel family protein [Hymenobacter ruricola]MBF9221352.1 TonB-dependent receptor [Hymenobacter ruricola]
MLSAIRGVRRGLWLGLLAALPLTAQGQAVVRGVVRDAQGGAVELATTTLHRATDSTLVKSDYSDAAGAFQLAAAPGGRYLVSVTQVGFARYWSAPFELPAAGLLLPPVALVPSAATALEEVTVLGQKPLFEHLADRTVVNVEGSTLAAGNTALDVLSRSPGVTVDGSDNLALRGKQGLLVLIDGKRQAMSGTELADYLRTLPAEQLKSIELINNPPASYDAQGGAGIIAIALKKDQRQGTNGTANLSYGRGTFGRYSAGLSLNHRRGPMNGFGTYTYADLGNYVRAVLRRDFFAPGQAGSRTDQEDYSATRTRAHSWKVGLDYDLSARTTLGVAANGLASTSAAEGTNALTLRDAAQRPLAALQSDTYRRTAAPTVAGNLNLRHAFADSSTGPSLAADVNYASFRTTRQQGLTALPEAPAAPRRLTGDQAGQLTLRTAQLDYTHPLARRRQLSAGAKISQVSSDNDVVFWQTLDGVTTVDPAQTNRFRYEERVDAAYVSVEQAGAKATLRAGLRGEQTTARGVQAVGNESFERQYFQLFPSASLSYKLSARHELALALSRRLDRPSYDDLNPFRVYLNATTFRSGNAGLLPQTSYVAELTHTFLQQYSLALSYSNTQNPFVLVTQPATSASGQPLVIRPVNLRAEHYLDLTLSVPVAPCKGWAIDNGAVLFYDQYTGELADTRLNRGRLALLLTSTHTVTLPRDWGLDLSARYQSPAVSGFSVTRATGELTAGAQKRLWKGRGTFKLNVTDLLYTNRARVTSTYGTYAEYIAIRRDTRAATLAFSYRLGNDQLPPTRRADTAGDEKRRAGGL